MKKKYWIPLAVIAILVITNPSPDSFNKYASGKSWHYASNYGSGGSNVIYDTVIIRRDWNFFICSIYSVHTGQQYFAILGNFFMIW